MTALYAICAALGGTVLVCQFAMTLLGLGHDHDGGLGDGHDGDLSDTQGGDFEHGHDGGGHASASSDHHDDSSQAANWFFAVVTFRTMTAALTFFGLAGLAMSARGSKPETTFVIALAAGGAAMYAVYSLMRGMSKLRSEGTAQIGRAVGSNGTVYLRVPAHRAGIGKVTVNVQNRTMEYQAVTANDELPTGAKIVVVGVVGNNTLEVEPAA